ncbi:ammonium transporter [Fimbriimonas ginsengisoli]|uniref:Ammonium transporter n=1 Tax=Fimbriimonas ginsengisoli Gsoil 348 TaxID=661478 RepID=A0A068NPW2_FIMGI|nr:ammonium transporter [Fimbriimonas ginsengisoli]AIE85471.1 ammonium transporter [Fimbriimonas ginsengisoli Gsoil 348]
MFKSRPFAAFVAATLCTSALAQAPTTPAAPAINWTDTLWVIIAAALVLLMTPALALFYGGMVRRKNVLSTFLHSFIMLGIVSILWLVIGYSIAFGKSGNGWIGNPMEFFGGAGISMKAPYPYFSPAGTIPAGAFMLFQMMFAIITPALISGAIAERMKFSGYVMFTTLWSLLIYGPIACWVWNPGGWLFQKGALDFAGGTVVHLASGVSALAACMVLGRRRALDHKEPILPNNLTTTLLGAGLLWFGWIGFNAGSALAVGDLALSAFTGTHVAAAAGMLGWLVCEKIRYGKPTALGAASGLVAGLVAITPGAGFLTPMSAILVGFVVGAICCMAVGLKHKFGFDDSLDVVGVHGVGGLLGAICTGIFASVEINPLVADALKTNGGRGGLILTQLIAVAVVGAFAFVGTLLLMKLTQAVVGVRATEEDESTGLDIALHGEAGYNL